MLLGYQIKSRLDACFPNGSRDAPFDSREWLPQLKSSVHVRNYGTEEKWIPGHVTSTSGTRMVTVETPGAIVRRHVDQVRLRPTETQSPDIAEDARPGGATFSPEESASQVDGRPESLLCFL